MESRIAAGMAKGLLGVGIESLKELAAADSAEHKDYSQTCRIWLLEFICQGSELAH